MTQIHDVLNLLFLLTGSAAFIKYLVR